MHLPGMALLLMETALLYRFALHKNFPIDEWHGEPRPCAAEADQSIGGELLVRSHSTYWLSHCAKLQSVQDMMAAARDSCRSAAESDVLQAETAFVCLGGPAAC